nr:galacturonosyltransferase 8 [Ipomoea trifida]
MAHRFIYGNGFLSPSHFSIVFELQAREEIAEEARVGNGGYDAAPDLPRANIPVELLRFLSYCRSFSLLYISDLKSVSTYDQNSHFSSDLLCFSFALISHVTNQFCQSLTYGYDWECVRGFHTILMGLHCLAIMLMEERIVNPDKYTDEGKPTPPEIEDPN